MGTNWGDESADVDLEPPVSIFKLEKYRSDPYINGDYDRGRIVIDLPVVYAIKLYNFLTKPIKT
jgi:hypothetical protein